MARDITGVSELRLCNQKVKKKGGEFDSNFSWMLLKGHQKKISLKKLQLQFLRETFIHFMNITFIVRKAATYIVLFSSDSLFPVITERIDISC